MPPRLLLGKVLDCESVTKGIGGLLCFLHSLPMSLPQASTTLLLLSVGTFWKGSDRKSSSI